MSFVITATRAITWPALSLHKGANRLRSRAQVPSELWPPLARLRARGFLSFDGDPSVTLDGTTEADLRASSMPELAALAKAAGVSLPAGARKRDAVGALLGRLRGEAS